MSTSTFTRQTIATTDAPAAIGPYSQAVLVSGGRTLYCSGQIPLDPKTGQIVGEGDVEVQTKQVLDNLQAVLRAADMGFGEVVRCGIFLADMGDFAVVNRLYAERFANDPPARATVQVAVLPKNVAVEIDAIAVAPMPTTAD
ncbi:MAG TPA: RidA family protein [Nannocystis exedens]|nr:RidA family protein [Nannocystis exedens]